MAKSRGQKAVYNVIAGMGEEIVTMICGLILPRLILSTFGSTYNGLVSSISQFISVISLMKAGIGGVTRASLYKPLANNDTQAISAIVNQTERFMRRVALLFVGFVLVFAAVYSFSLMGEFDWLFSFTLIIIISLSTFAQYYFGFTYSMLLSAGQKQWVTACVNIGAIIANTVIASVLILLGASIHVVKLGSAFVYVVSPFIIYTYTRRKYKIDKTVTAKADLLKQRWDAVAHEVANFVNSNTDIMVLTIFVGLGPVSIYSVHYLVINSLRKVVTHFITGFGAAFGDMYAKGEKELLNKNLRLFELIVFSLVSIIYSVTFVMLTPFVMVYTHGVTDVNYYQPVFAFLITMAGAFSCMRIPYETIVKSAGHYRQTRNASIVEAVINITVSIACVIPLGLVGVAIGTLAAAIYRTLLYATYMSRNVAERSIGIFVKRLAITGTVFAGTILLAQLYTTAAENVGQWIVGALITTAIAVTLTALLSMVFFRSDVSSFGQKVRNVVRRGGKAKKRLE